MNIFFVGGFMGEVLHLEGEILSLVGVVKVVSTTQNQSVVEFGQKTVVISGENIEVVSLNLEEGKLCLKGKFSNIKMGQGGEKKPFYKRIFK